MATEAAMNHAGRTSSHPFRDLRSAAHAKHRTRARKEKYNNFRNISPADLPSSANPPQQSHYLPFCIWPNCRTAGTPDGHILSLFPADLSTAPVARFTKREAYNEAQCAQPSKCRCSFCRRFRTEEGVKRAMANEDWRLEVYDREGEDIMLGDMDQVERYMAFGVRPELVPITEQDVGEIENYWQWDERKSEEAAERLARLDNGEDEGYASRGDPRDNDTTVREEEGESSVPIPEPTKLQERFWSSEGWQWRKHRNFTGCWFISPWTCGRNYCYCHEEWGDWDPEERPAVPLAEWCRGLLSEESLDEDESDDSQSSVDEDWDIVSTSSSWTELEDLESDLETQQLLE